MVIDRLSGARCVRLHWDIPDEPLAMQADRQKLDLVLSQVLSTAADATSTGEVWIRVRENGRDVLILVVSGSGPEAAAALDSGIAAARADGESPDADLETVALAVARRVARTMGGDLGVIRTHAAEKAVLLSIRLPRAATEEAGAPELSSATA